MPPVRSLFFHPFFVGGTVLGLTILIEAEGSNPLRQKEAQMRRDVSGLRERIKEARDEFHEIKEQEQAVGRERSALNAVHPDVPPGPAVVWFPVRLKEHLRRFGVAEVVIRQNTALPEPGLAGFERTYWRLSFPAQESVRDLKTLLTIAAEFEQQYTFVKVLDVSLHSESQGSAGGFNIAALVRK